MRLNLTPAGASIILAEVLHVIDSDEQVGPALDRALDKLERTDRPTLAPDEAAALRGALLRAMDGAETVPPTIARVLDRLEREV